VRENSASLECVSVSTYSTAAGERTTRTGGSSDIVKAQSSGEDPRATGGLVFKTAHHLCAFLITHWRKSSKTKQI